MDILLQFTADINVISTGRVVIHPVSTPHPLNIRRVSCEIIDIGDDGVRGAGSPGYLFRTYTTAILILYTVPAVQVRILMK